MIHVLVCKKMSSFAASPANKFSISLYSSLHNKPYTKLHNTLELNHTNRTHKIIIQTKKIKVTATKPIGPYFEYHHIKSLLIGINNTYVSF